MYYIYGHYLDGKCIYIGSNCVNMKENRAYDLSDRNKEYAKITKGRKEEIEVKILKEFPDVRFKQGTNGYILSEEMKLIQEFHDRGEALCSNQDYRGIRNPMHGKHHSEESIEKNRQSNLNYYSTNRNYFDSLSKEEQDKFRFISGNATRGKIWIYKDKIRKYILPEELDKYIKDGWTKGRPSEIISKGNKNRDLSKSRFIKRTKCQLEHNNIKIMFDSVGELYKYCKEKYDLSDGTIKMLLKSEKEFIPYYSRLQNAKGLKLKRLN